MHQRIVAGLMALLMALALFSTAFAETSFSFVNENLNWSTPANQADRMVRELGFEPRSSFESEDGRLRYLKGKLFGQSCKWISLDYENEQLTGLFFFFLKNKTSYSRTVSGLDKAFGAHEEGWMIRLVNGRQESFQALVWHTGDTDAYLTAVQSSTLSKAKSGSAAFMVSVLPSGTQQHYTTYSNGENAAAAPIVIRSCKITVDSSGTPKVAPVFRNDSDEVILAFTFEMQCFDKEGRLIVGYGSRERNWADYEHALQPGKLSKSLTWVNSGREGVNSIYMAISSYTKADGTIVTIPQEEQLWVRFTK